MCWSNAPNCNIMLYRAMLYDRRQSHVAVARDRVCNELYVDEVCGDAHKYIMVNAAASHRGGISCIVWVDIRGGVLRGDAM